MPFCSIIIRAYQILKFCSVNVRRYYEKSLQANVFKSDGRGLYFGAGFTRTLTILAANKFLPRINAKAKMPAVFLVNCFGFQHKCRPHVEAAEILKFGATEYNWMVKFSN